MNKVLRVSDIDNAPQFCGIARHVSTEGCQFMIRGKLPEIGDMLLVIGEGVAPITGRVRWILSDRIGFAFEPPIEQLSWHALEQLCREGQLIHLYKA